jgi:hypothetical protein
MADLGGADLGGAADQRTMWPDGFDWQALASG